MRFKQHIINENKLNDLSDANLINMLIKDCMPFLKELLKSLKKDRLFLSSGRQSNDYVFKRKVRTDRYPKDTPEDIHNSIDKLFKIKFGWKARSNVIFCTGNVNIAMDYGTPYMIFPIGKFKFVWSPKIWDLYNNVIDSDDNIILPEDPDYILYDDEVDIEQEAMNRLNYEYEEYISSLNPDEDDYIEFDDWMEENKDLKSMMQEIAERRAEDNKYENKELLKRVVRSYTDKDLGKALKSKSEIMINCKEYYGVKYTTYYNLLLNYFTYYGLRHAEESMLNDIRG